MNFFRSLKRLVTGKVVHRIDTDIHNGATTMSLRLKLERGTSTPYVMLAGLSGGNYQYFEFKPDEFTRFAAAVKDIEKSLQKSPSQLAALPAFE